MRNSVDDELWLDEEPDVISSSDSRKGNIGLTVAEHVLL